MMPQERTKISRPVLKEPPKIDPGEKEDARNARQRSQEALDIGVWAALDLCRQARASGEKYNPFQAFEQRIILLALRSTLGNQLQAAKLLGISRSTLRKRMQKHKILIGMKIIGSA